MSYFDPQKGKNTLETFSLDFDRSYERGERGKFFKGMVSTSIFSTCIIGILVGSDSQTQDLAERTQRWLQEAIDEGECTTDRGPSSADWHQQRLSYVLALTKFLRGQGIDRESFSRSASLTGPP